MIVSRSVLEYPAELVGEERMSSGWLPVIILRVFAGRPLVIPGGVSSESLEPPGWFCPQAASRME